MKSSFTFGMRLSGTPAENRPAVEAALKSEGFGVVTEIDVAATIKARLGIDRPAYLILGACHPQLAHRALEVEPSIGALLPCNVVLRADEDGTIVEAIDPVATMRLIDAPGMAAISTEARTRLARALSRIRPRH